MAWPRFPHSPYLATIMDSENRVWVFGALKGFIVYQRQSRPNVW